MATISINQVAFVTAMDSMRNNANNINTYKQGWSSLGEKSKVFDSYVNMFMQLHDIMQAYKNLALKDIESIEVIGKKTIEIDGELIDIWR